MNKIKELVEGQTFDDEIAVLGGFLTKSSAETTPENQNHHENSGDDDTSLNSLDTRSEEVKIIDELSDTIIGKQA